MNLKNLLPIIAALTISTSLLGQSIIAKVDLFDLNKNGKLELQNRTLTSVTDNARKVVRFSEADGEGVAWLEGANFTNGVIELDIKGRDVLQKSFVGVAFHGQDHKTFDAIYFRPFNFQTSDSVRHIHAVQYISHPDFPWERLRKEQNAKYEKAITPAPDPNEWFHAKIVVEYPHVKVYVNNNSEPSLTVDKLNERKTGKIGLWVGHGSNGDFANLTITTK